VNPAEAISEASKSFISRATNPVIGTFISSWLVINWKIVLLVFMSKSTVEEIILLIEKEHFHIEKILYYPLIFALAYLLATPWIGVIYTYLTNKAEIVSGEIIYRKKTYINQLEKSAMLADPKLKFPYESIEKVLATVFLNMTEKEKRHIITSIRSQLPENNTEKSGI